VTVRVVDFPPPENPCPTKADVEELASLLPRPADPLSLIRIEHLGMRFIDAAAYCQTAEERLR